MTEKPSIKGVLEQLCWNYTYIEGQRQLDHATAQINSIIEQEKKKMKIEVDEEELETIIAQEVNRWEVKPAGQCIPITCLAHSLATNINKWARVKEE